MLFILLERNLECSIGAQLLGRGTRDLDVKRIQQKRSAPCEVVGDARHHSEVVKQGYGNDKFVDGVVVIVTRTQSPQKLNTITIKGQHTRELI